ncbi:MAG: stage III sporulation protein AC [Clostridiales bacterium]|nr:stage III sporulation protein AC [Clostridiales bacterium]HBM80153.1 stage III sporulation protein AC [Clostridiaceae bacterium]
MELDVSLIFKIAAIGILIAVLDQILRRAGREEQAMMTTLAGLVVVMLLVINLVSKLFNTVRTLFQLY